MQKVITLAATFGVSELILVNSENTVKSYLQSKVLLDFEEFIFKGLEQSAEVYSPNVWILKNFYDVSIHITHNTFFAI